MGLQFLQILEPFMRCRKKSPKLGLPLRLISTEFCLPRQQLGAAIDVTDFLRAAALRTPCLLSGSLLPWCAFQFVVGDCAVVLKKFQFLPLRVLTAPVRPTN